MGRSYTLYNLRIILVLTLGSLTFGYGFSVISNTLGQPGFISYFNFEQNPAHAQAITGTINGLFCAGAIFGSLTVGWMCEARGRKETMYLASVVNIIGEALEAGSVNIGMFLVARFIAGWGIGMMVVLIPIYQAEIGESISQPASLLSLIHRQHHQALAVSWLASTVPGLSLDTLSLAGLALGLSIRVISPFNGAFPSLWLASHPWLCLHAALGSRNLLVGVRPSPPLSLTLEY
jgi:MFS family permease